MRLKMKNRSQRYDINKPKSRRGHKYIKCKMSLGVMMVICIKQNLSNIWSSINENNVAFKKACPFVWTKNASSELLWFWIVLMLI